MKIDPSCCRLCFIHADEPIDILGEAVTEFNIVDVLAQYFLDQVLQDDALPKVVCHDCWSKIETFHSFVQHVIAVREDYSRQHLNERVKEEGVPVGVSTDEIEIHQENVCVEPVSVINDDTLKGEIELMNTKCQIDVDTDEDEKVSTNDEKFGDTWSDTDQVDDQNTRNVETLVHIDIDTGSTKSSVSELESQRFEKKHAYENCNKKFGSKILAQKQITHPKKPRKPKCHICNERFKAQKSLDYHLKSSHFGGLDGYGQEIKEMVLNVSEDQIKEAMDKFVHEKTCDLCSSTKFCSFLDARNHYSKFHNSLGHINCCNIRLRSNNEFLDHIYCHFNPTVFKCRLCHKDMKTRAKLLLHIKGHEALKAKDFTCEYCKKSFQVSFNLAKHISRCPAKRAIQPKRPSLSSDDPPTDESSPDERPMNVSTCHEKTEDVIIADYFDMQCDLCSVVLTSLDDAKSHYLEVHRMENGYLKCCDTKFMVNSLIKDHLAWHKDPNVFRCNECNKSYLNRQGLVKHKKNHSRDFVCDICNKKYSSILNLTKHMQSHEKRERNFICDICNKGFYKKIVLNAHIKTHQQDKKHICEICGKGFITKSHLKSHAKVHDETNNERQFQCDICHRRFTTKYTLAAHMLAHTEPQKCDQCDKIAPNLSALKAHIRHVHCESKFECHLCDKKFKVQSTLKDHIASHKGERNNKCTFCDATFVLQRNMHSHRKKRHKEQWMAEMAKTKAKCSKL